MDVREAISKADALLPGAPIDDAPDPRWQAIGEVGEFVESEPAAIWDFICRWGNHQQEDLRDAIATCLLEHLLEYHFDASFPRVQKQALADPLFGRAFLRYWQFGQSEEPGNAERFEKLQAELLMRESV